MSGGKCYEETKMEHVCAGEDDDDSDDAIDDNDYADEEDDDAIDDNDCADEEDDDSDDVEEDDAPNYEYQELPSETNVK